MAMVRWSTGRRKRVGGFLTRLRRDVRGNTLAIMGAALIPFAGLVGGGIDLSRMYITKTRLQHACDAGALAGRKMMGSGTWGSDDSTAATQYFDANFTTSGMYGGNAPTKAFVENAGKVTGTASATLPLTLMRIFGYNTSTLEVTCEADMRLPNTDIMFVLDTTGSMAEIPIGDTVPKIASLKTAVKCFYEIVARLDTGAACTTGTPSGGTGNQVQIRFGFVPYATNVNIGRLLNPAWFANSRDFQTREAKFAPVKTTSTPAVIATTFGNPDPRNWTTLLFPLPTAASSSSVCAAQPVPGDTAYTPVNPEGPRVEFNTTGTNPKVTTWVTYQYSYYYRYRRSYDGGTKLCFLQSQQVFGDVRRVYSQSETTTQQFSGWRYAKLPVDVGLLKNGAAWKSTYEFDWPIGPGGTARKIAWKGCVEERQTISQASYAPIPSGAKDLNIDMVPTTDATTQWGMVLPDLIHTRAGWNSWDWKYDPVESTTDDYPNASYYACPVESKLLQSWTDASAFDDYVDLLTPEGNTYHDIGLLWGARLISPDGLFAATNKLTSQGGEIDRNVIFMTDGDPCTGINNYTAYGVAWFDRRQTDVNVAPTDGCTQGGTLTDQVNARTQAICSAIKNKNITLWVITFGVVDPRTVTRMTACATTGRYYSANNAAALQSTFASIANQISQLRLTN